ncbi:MAG: ribosomal protein [Candidatus Parcubacteria bacterium]|nr:ribosomal protein [Candidatus Parcubacteria bacterium]
MHIKKGDLVTVRSGDDKGKTAKVIMALPRENKVVVEGVNVMKKHQRPMGQGKKGSLVEVAMPMSVSNLIKADEAKKEAKESKAEAKKEPKKDSKKK